MHSNHILEEIDTTLDALIQNAHLLQFAAYGDKEQETWLQQEQEALLQQLFALNSHLSEEEKEIHLQKDPYLYGYFHTKLSHFSDLNKSLLKEPKEIWVKQARVHRNRKTPTS